jgi:hypothetical protein
MPLLARGAAVPLRPGKLTRGNLSQSQPCVDQPFTLNCEAAFVTPALVTCLKGDLSLAAALRRWAPAGNLSLLFVPATRCPGPGSWALASARSRWSSPTTTGARGRQQPSPRWLAPSISRHGLPLSPAQESSAPAKPSSSKVLGLFWALLGPHARLVPYARGIPRRRRTSSTPRPPASTGNSPGMTVWKRCASGTNLWSSAWWPGSPAGWCRCRMAIHPDGPSMAERCLGVSTPPPWHPHDASGAWWFSPGRLGV